MNIASRMTEWRNLKLPYDAKVEYLESTGTQWTDTGVMISRDSVMECELSVTAVVEWGVFFCAIWGNSDVATSGVCYRQRGRDDGVSIWNGTSISDPFKSVNVLGRHAYSLSLTSAKVDGLEWWSGAAPETLGSATVKLLWDGGAIPHWTSNLRKGKCRIYSFGHRIGDGIVSDFIPVRIGQVGYFYDKISRQLFGNSGTGSFIVGPDL